MRLYVKKKKGVGGVWLTLDVRTEGGSFKGTLDTDFLA